MPDPATRARSQPSVCFRQLYDGLTAGGIEVGIQLVNGAHRIVLSAPDGREIRFPAGSCFDRAASLLVASAHLREVLLASGQACDPPAGGDVYVSGRWPELAELWPPPAVDGEPG